MIFNDALWISRLLVALAMAVPIHAADRPITKLLSGTTIDIYVSPEGSDGNSGRARSAKDETGPLKSIMQARRVVRDMTANEHAPSQIVVHVLYERLEPSDPLAFDSSDSGKENCRIIWKTDVGTVISARRRGGIPYKVTENAILDMVMPKYRNRLYALDLKEAIGAEVTRIGGGFDDAEAPVAILYRGSSEMHFSRYPKTGYMEVKSVHGQSRFEVENEIGYKEGMLNIDDPRCLLWSDDANAHLHGYWCWDWGDQRHRIERIDRTNGLITMRAPWHTLGYRAGRPCYAFNVLAELSEIDEWYLELASRKAYFLDYDEKRPISVSFHDQAILVSGAEYISINGFRVGGARQDGIVMRNCRNTEIANCVVSSCGSWGIRIDGGASVSVKGCEVSKCGNGGIYMDGGTRTSLTAAKHNVADNSIHGIATWNWVYQPAVRCSGVGNSLSHNLIFDVPHEAVSLSGNDHTIEFNDISQACKQSRDAGVIYAWNDWSCRGNVIRWNFIHNCHGLDGGGCNGVYLDDHFSSAAITENLFYDINRSILIGGGRDNKIAANAFIRCNPAIVLDARGLTWQKEGIRELRNKLQAMPYRNEQWKARYPELFDILAQSPMAPVGNIIANNSYDRGEFLDIEQEAKPFVTTNGNAAIPSLKPKNGAMSLDDLLAIPEIRRMFATSGSRPGLTKPRK